MVESGVVLARSRIWTIPNLLSFLRIAGVPVAVWLLLSKDDPIGAAVLFGILGATDWVDGFIARKFDQTSELGKLLDPTADRVLLIALVIAALVDSRLPVWIGVIVLGREVVISIAVVALGIAGAPRVDVRWTGKAGTLSLMFGLPCFVAASALDGATDLLTTAGWILVVTGAALSYFATAAYIPDARGALNARTLRQAEQREEFAK